MNVMAQAHKMTKITIEAKKANGLQCASYRLVFKFQLRIAHKEYKAMQAQKTVKLALIGSTLEADKDATWFSLEGTATDSEGNQVHIAESGSSLGVQCSADWYFCRTNGFTNIELYACLWGLEDVKQSFKITR